MPAPTPISAMAESHSPRCPMASLSRSAATLVPCDSSSASAVANESACPGKVGTGFPRKDMRQRMNLARMLNDPIGMRASVRPLAITEDACSGAALHHAVGLDRDLGVGRRQVAPQDAVLLIAWLLAGDLDVVRADFLAKAWNLVGAERIGSRHHAAAVLHGHGHFRIWNG